MSQILRHILTVVSVGVRKREHAQDIISDWETGCKTWLQDSQSKIKSKFLVSVLHKWILFGNGALRGWECDSYLTWHGCENKTQYILLTRHLDRHTTLNDILCFTTSIENLYQQDDSTKKGDLDQLALFAASRRCQCFTQKAHTMSTSCEHHY